MKNIELIWRGPLRVALKFSGLCALMACLSCGYTSGLLVPDGARSVGIDVYANTSKLRNLEVELTEEVAQVVTNLVNLPLVPPDEADFVIRGQVIDYRRNSGARDDDNRRLQSSVIITIVTRLVNRRTDEVVRTTLTALGTGNVIERGVVDDDTPEEVEARDRAIENLASRIVLDLFLPGSRE